MPDKMSIAELSAAIKRREPRLAQIPDAELVRKVFERRPELMSMINTSEPRRPLDLYGKVGSRLKQNLDVPKQTEGAASAIHEGLRNIREHGPSKMPEFLAALKQYAKPENVLGDALTALIFGQGGGSKPSTPKALEAPLSSEHLNAIRAGGEGMRRSSAEFIQDIIKRQGLPKSDPSLADIDAIMKGRAAEVTAKYPVPQWQRIQDHFAAPSQPTAFTQSATDWHNTALAQAKAKLGPEANIGDVLQLAAKIQRAGQP